ncbi:hypothetical protein [Micromonospora zamorensis]|uniref:hypothetical protein n=1 Tax=Micromonospora zamorensis TaxID=709883 RepID=UPI00379B4999
MSGADASPVQVSAADERLGFLEVAVSWQSGCPEFHKAEWINRIRIRIGPGRELH